MADRVVKVTLQAQIADYKKKMAEAAEVTETAAQKSARELKGLEDQLKQVEDATKLVGQAAFGLGALITAGVGVAVSKAADFNQAMSYVAATGADARDSFDELGGGR